LVENPYLLYNFMINVNSSAFKKDWYMLTSNEQNLIQACIDMFKETDYILMSKRFPEYFSDEDKNMYVNTLTPRPMD